jgi:hypothetical protein
MKKFHVIGIALVAVFAFFALATTSAFAEELLWLVNGADFAGTLEAETEGFLELHRLSSGGATAGTILCEGIFDGSITNPAVGNGTDETTKVLTLTQVDVGADNGSTLTGTGITCDVTVDTGDTTFCKTGVGTAKVWPANLPWLSELELMEPPAEPGSMWLDHLFKVGTEIEPGYEVECTILLGIKATDLCTGLTSAQVLLTLETLPGTAAEGSHGEFNWEAPIESEEGFCSTACPNTTPCAGLLGLGVTWAVEGELNRLETDVSEM